LRGEISASKISAKYNEQTISLSLSLLQLTFIRGMHSQSRKS